MRIYKSSIPVADFHLARENKRRLSTQKIPVATKNIINIVLSSNCQVILLYIREHFMQHCYPAGAMTLRSFWSARIISSSLTWLQILSKFNSILILFFLTSIRCLISLFSSCSDSCPSSSSTFWTPILTAFFSSNSWASDSATNLSSFGVSFFLPFMALIQWFCNIDSNKIEEWLSWFQRNWSSSVPQQPSSNGPSPRGASMGQDIRCARITPLADTLRPRPVTTHTYHDNIPMNVEVGQVG